MIDPMVEYAAFRQGLREAVAENEAARATLAEEPPEQIEDKSVVEAKPRDEKGRFVSQETSETEVTEEPAKPTPELILGRFTSPEEVTKAYQELERKMSEQGQELGELRKLRERLDDLERAKQDYSPAEFRQALSDDPAYATQLAYEQGDQRGMLMALGEWKEADPFAAAVWIGEVKRQQDIAALRQEYEQRTEPLAAQYQNSMIGRAWNAVSRRHPDMEGFGDTLLEAAQAAPEFVTALRSGNEADAERMFENLYWIAVGKQSKTLSEATLKVSEAQAEESRRAKADARVATASSSPTEEEKSPMDELADRIIRASGSTVQSELARSSRQ